MNLHAVKPNSRVSVRSRAQSRI